MKTYPFGVETVPVSLAGDLLIGSVHDGRAYKIMLARLNGEEIVETRFLSGKNDWEGHSVAKLDEGYLIGGAVEGFATPDGGEGWKGYIARLNKNLEVLWDRKLEILGNEAVYSILPAGEGAFIAGDTSDGKSRGFFLGEIAPEGKVLWLRTFGPWEDAVISNLIELNGKLLLVGSLKEEKWKIKAFEFGENGEVIRESELAEGIALTAVKMGRKIILGGYTGRDFWVWSENWEVTLPNGAATSLLLVEDGLLVGGEVEGNAALIKVRNGEIVSKRTLWENGAVEVLGKGAALGVKKEEGKRFMAVETTG